jgi:hypothetical protein
MVARIVLADSLIPNFFWQSQAGFDPGKNAKIG